MTRRQLILAGMVLSALVSAISAMTTLTPRFEPRKRFQPPLSPPKGQVKETVEWLNKCQEGNYYKWLVANRLGRIAREILFQREGHPIGKKFGRLEGGDWNPPPNLGDYLDSGLNGSFADYPRPRFWQKSSPTPLDADPKQVIEYLENEMKNRP
jgi:hypothetical protein